MMMSEPIFIKGSLLWDGSGSKTVPDPVLVVENGILKGVTKEVEIGRQSDNRIFSYPGATLMPGLIDCHTHLSMDPTLENYLDHMADPVAVLTLRAAAMMRKDLQAGTTTCRCMGDREFLDIACRTAVENQEIAGPHLLVATRGIRAPEGHGFVGYPFAGKEAIRKAILENIQAGTDLIKIYITGTLKGDGNLPSYLSHDEIKTAIHSAHESSVPIASHCVGGIGLDWALDLGIDTLEHAYHITDAQIDRLARSETWLVLTPSPLLNDERVKHLPIDLIEGHRQERAEIRERMSKTISAGFPFAVGSDGMHGDLVNEISYLIEMGADSVTALQAATINGAKAASIDQTRGTLQHGKWADILVVEGNPLENIEALRQVKGVFKKGELQTVI